MGGSTKGRAGQQACSMFALTLAMLGGLIAFHVPTAWADAGATYHGQGWVTDYCDRAPDPATAKKCRDIKDTDPEHRAREKH